MSPGWWNLISGHCGLQGGEGARSPHPVAQMLLVDFYKGAPDLVRFQEAWSPEHSYLDKLKVSRWHQMPRA